MSDLLRTLAFLDPESVPVDILKEINNEKSNLSARESNSVMTKLKKIWSWAAQREQEEDTQTVDIQDETIQNFIQEDFTNANDSETVEDSQNKARSKHSFSLKRSGRLLERTSSREKRNKAQESTTSSHGSSCSSASHNLLLVNQKVK